MNSSADSAKIGILIPTYNRREYLELALRSALGQTHPELELIVIDNGSCDGTAGYMASIGDPRVRYVVNERNLGLLGSINKGVGLFAKEVEWCTILPDDDLLGEGFVACMAAALEKSDARAVIHGKRVLIDGEGTVIREVLPARDESAFEYLENRYRRERETFLTGVFFSRKAFESIGGYPQFATGMATDDAFIFALSMSDRLVYEENAVAFVRMHEGAESHEANSLRHMAALVDFRSYVLGAASKNWTASQLADGLPRLVEMYISSLASSFWLRDVKALVKRPAAEAADRIAELCKLVGGSGLTFSLRIRMSAAVRRWFGLFPERWLPYRAVWEAMRRSREALARLGGRHCP